MTITTAHPQRQTMRNVYEMGRKESERNIIRKRQTYAIVWKNTKSLTAPLEYDLEGREIQQKVTISYWKVNTSYGYLQ